MFLGCDTDTTYTVKVTLVLNGKAIATAQKKIKSLPQDQLAEDEKHNLIVSQLNIQSIDSPNIVRAGAVATLTTGFVANKEEEELHLDEAAQQENTLDEGPLDETILLETNIDMQDQGTF